MRNIKESHIRERIGLIEEGLKEGVD